MSKSRPTQIAYGHSRFGCSLLGHIFLGYDAAAPISQTHGTTATSSRPCSFRSGGAFDLTDRGQPHLPPSCWPCVTPIGTSRDQVVPSEGKQCEQQGDADGCDQETPRHVVDDHHQRIDPGRWVERPGQVHHDHGHASRQRSGPRCGSTYFDHEQAHERRYEVSAKNPLAEGSEII